MAISHTIYRQFQLLETEMQCLLSFSNFSFNISQIRQFLILHHYIADIVSDCLENHKLSLNILAYIEKYHKMIRHHYLNAPSGGPSSIALLVVRLMQTSILMITLPLVAMWGCLTPLFLPFVTLNLQF